MTNTDHPSHLVDIYYLQWWQKECGPSAILSEKNK